MLRVFVPKKKPILTIECFCHRFVPLHPRQRGRTDDPLCGLHLAEALVPESSGQPQTNRHRHRVYVPHPHHVHVHLLGQGLAPGPVVPHVLVNQKIESRPSNSSAAYKNNNYLCGVGRCIKMY